MLSTASNPVALRLLNGCISCSAAGKHESTPPRTQTGKGMEEIKSLLCTDSHSCNHFSRVRVQRQLMVSCRHRTLNHKIHSLTTVTALYVEQRRAVYSEENSANSNTTKVKYESTSEFKTHVPISPRSVALHPSASICCRLLSCKRLKSIRQHHKGEQKQKGGEKRDEHTRTYEREVRACVWAVKQGGREREYLSTALASVPGEQTTTPSLPR